jgi:hypothetical protein
MLNMSRLFGTAVWWNCNIFFSLRQMPGPGFGDARRLLLYLLLCIMPVHYMCSGSIVNSIIRAGAGAYVPKNTVPGSVVVFSLACHHLRASYSCSLINNAE